MKKPRIIYPQKQKRRLLDRMNSPWLAAAFTAGFIGLGIYANHYARTQGYDSAGLARLSDASLANSWGQGQTAKMVYLYGGAY